MPYLKSLGVDWIYLSPILTAEKGSDHGYDVTDPCAMDPARGGTDGPAHASAAARETGLGVLVDIVPNHMGVGTAANIRGGGPCWRRAEESRYAEAFDIDWDSGGGKIRIPVLGDGRGLDALEMTDGELRYTSTGSPWPRGGRTEGADRPGGPRPRSTTSWSNWRRADAS